MIAGLDPQEILMLVLIFIPLQLAVPHKPEQKIFRKQWTSDVLYLLFNGIFITLGYGLFIAFLLPHVQALLPSAVVPFIARQSLWVQLPLAFVVSEIGYYIAHRSFHVIPFLWRFHAVHHSIEELDWLAARRVHPVDQIITSTLTMMPILVLGFSVPTVAIYVFTHVIQSHLVHANCRLSFGPLRWVFATPHFHRWHHANQPGKFDLNFSARLIFMDVLFGTFYMPKAVDDAPAQYGTQEPVPRTYPRQLAYPFLPRHIQNAMAAPPATSPVEAKE